MVGTRRMSIYGSVNQHQDITALAAADLTDDYRADGEPSLTVDVATATSYHDHVRLSAWSTQDRDAAWMLLSPESTRLLRDALDEALHELARTSDRR